MSSVHWQSRFESWLHETRQHGDQAHDIAHLRRVWQTAQRIMQETEADELVVLAGCYFHDIVNLPKNHPERHLASAKAAVEAAYSARRIRIFLKKNRMPWPMWCTRTASARR